MRRTADATGGAGAPFNFRRKRVITNLEGPIMGNGKDEPCESGFVLSPIVFVAFLSTCLVCGTWWIPYAIVMLVASSVIGYYAESKINGLDAAVREKAFEKYGRRQDADASDLGVFVRKMCQVTGLFFPVIPAVTLVAAAYMSHRAKKIRKIKVNNRWGGGKLARGFEAPGRCVF